ncbi:MAG: GEGP motif-containing diheme protein [Syntrophobacteraceae bacterium]
MRVLVRVLQLLIVTAIVFSWDPSYCAYNHRDEIDSPIFVSVHPNAAGSKLDSCNLCHSAGSYVQGGKTVSLGSCQWCHYTYGYDAHGNIQDTLNPFGLAYLTAGRSEAALEAIGALDSDGDGYSNLEEIAATRYPGDPNDDPSKVVAPYRIYSIEDLQKMKQHSQLLLMNATKSTDSYSKYTGVAMRQLLLAAGILPDSSGVRVFSPDGFSTYHPLYPDPDPAMYHLYGTYPEGLFHYSDQANVDMNETGWCAYNSPSVQGMVDGAPIVNKSGLKVMLAYKRDGDLLTPGVLNDQNKLDGEGPFRLVPPQKVPCPPDQRSTATDATDPSAWIWPFDNSADHNAGYSTRTTTIIRVEPMPAGTTDVDVLEAGWSFVDEKKIIVYGAIDPIPNVNQKLGALRAYLCSLKPGAFKNRVSRQFLLRQLGCIKRLVAKGQTHTALKLLENRYVKGFDGCERNGSADPRDLVTDCMAQKQVYWSIHEMIVLLRILEKD